ncbi:hypothetical protein CDAR_5501 [Caerostris darwini]|uniref:Uncharacterized protein n=1 Tax=Caerostris darwini TaxID=1538125 RepID=A0AAV4PM84_9ARAC|nr:hypothetical protein CDAR_5501 [Caerostris darwini]
MAALQNNNIVCGKGAEKKSFQPLKRSWWEEFPETKTDTNLSSLQNNNIDCGERAEKKSFQPLKRSLWEELS